MAQAEGLSEIGLTSDLLLGAQPGCFFSRTAKTIMISQILTYKGRVAGNTHNHSDGVHRDVSRTGRSKVFKTCHMVAVKPTDTESGWPKLDSRLHHPVAT